MAVIWVGDEPGTFINESTVVPVDADNLNAITRTVDKIATGGALSGLDADTWRGLNPSQLLNVSDEGLIAFYSFDTLKGGIDGEIVSDDSDSNPGVIHGTPTVVAGLSGKALVLEGTSSYVSGTYSNSTSYTISCWYKGTVSSGEYKILNLMRSSNGSKLNLALSSGSVEFQWRNASAILQTISGGAINDGVYHLITGIYNGTSGFIYVDGILKQSLTQSLITDFYNETRIGATEETIPLSFLPGSVDEVRIYNRALNANEVYGLYTNKSGSKSCIISTENLNSSLAKRKSDGSLEATTMQIPNGSFNLILDNTTIHTADKTLSLNVNDADREISLSGDLTLANDFSTAGNFPQTLTATASTNVTLPVTGTLATLGGSETLTNKTLTSPVINNANNSSFTGIPTAPTAAINTDTTQIATTEFVNNEIENDTLPLTSFKAYSPSYSYVILEPCFYNGIPYKSLSNANSGNQPDISPTFWEVTGGGSGGSDVNVGYNYENGQFESNILGYVLYKDAAQATPVDGTGGTATLITFERNSTGPLVGTGDGLLSKSSASAQGEGLSKDFTIDRGLVTQPVQINLIYETTSTYASDDIGIFIYDIVNSNLIYPSIIGLPATQFKPAQHLITFNPSTSTQYRLIFHIMSTSALSYSMKIDDIQVGSKNVAVGSIISEWRDYPLTINASPTPPTKGTTTLDKAQWRRVGSSMEGSYDYKQTGVGTSGSGTYLFPIPSGHNIDLISNPINSIIGSALLTLSSDEAGLSSAIGNIYVASATHFYIKAIKPTNTTDSLTLVTNAFYELGNATLVYRFHWSAKISSWTSNVNLASDFTEYASNSSVADADDLTSFYNGMDGSSATFTFTGNHTRRIRFNNPIHPTDTLTLEFYDSVSGNWISGTTIVLGGAGNVISNYGTTGAFLYCEATLVSKNHLLVFFNQYRYGTSHWSSAMTGLRWRVRKVSNGNMAEIPPLVFADYKGTIATTAPLVSINFATKIEDTHSCVTTGAGTWKFTAPIPGLYEIETNTYTLTAPANCMLHKNGVLYRYIGSTVGSSVSGMSRGKVRLQSGDYIHLTVDGANNVPIDANLWVTITRIGS